ncbi:MAG: tyrosine-protein phosphatase, partial [Kiritimatiellae bacterium]|nr:tyrosine-protein phosphatase [Kiritimatiellia bacterium]
MSLPSMDERRRLLDEDKSLRKSGEWGKSRPVVLKWAYTEKEDGPWKVEIGLASDLSDARVWYVKGKKQGKDAPSCCEMEYTVPFANLEIAKKYHWRVSGLRPESKDVVRSAISSFKTEDFAPRWIEIEGRVSNIRDLGGWRTSDGRRVRQGMAFRGQGLNDNAVSERRGRNRLMVEDIDYLTCTLGIRTDLDLRAKSEKADMTESPLG